MHACGGEVRSSRQKAAEPVQTTGATGESETDVWGEVGGAGGGKETEAGREREKDGLSRGLGEEREADRQTGRWRGRDGAGETVMPKERASLRKSEQRLEVGGHPRGKGAAVQAASSCAPWSRGPARTPYVCFRSVGLRSLHLHVAPCGPPKGAKPEARRSGGGPRGTQERGDK